MVCGRKQINEEDVKVVLEVALDSALPARVKLLNVLLDNNGCLNTNEVMTKLRCSRPTALKEMETFVILGLAETGSDFSQLQTAGQPTKNIKLIKRLEWFLSDECKKLRNNK